MTTDHTWPLPGEHFYTPWRAYSRGSQYRTCIHPECSHVEYRANPKGSADG